MGLRASLICLIVEVFEGLLKFNPYLTTESIEALLSTEVMTEIGQRRMAVMKKEV